MAALASIKYQCSIYVDVISNKQSIFFQSDPHTVTPNELALPGSLHWSIQIILLYLNTLWAEFSLLHGF